MSKLKGILLTQGMHGMISQAEGLAKALDIDYNHHTVELNNFWKLVPPKLTPISKYVYKKIENIDFDVIISCGRKSVIPSIHLKNISNKKVFNIHIQDPKVNLKYFDFIVAPEHDLVTGNNVIKTKGNIHYITETKIKENKDYLKPIIKDGKKKICSLIIGGPTKHYDYSSKNIEKIFLNLLTLSKQNNFQILVIPSMRTPKNTIKFAKEYFGNDHTVVQNVDKKAYLSALAISDHIVVTCDSSSMISEAALTGKPIYIANILPKMNDERIQRFRNLFRELLVSRDLGDEFDTWSYEKLDETNRVAYIINQKIKN